MKVVIHEAAAADLDGIFDWISNDNPKAAVEMVRRVRARINRLAIGGLAHIGRPGSSREHASSSKLPTFIVYRVDEQAEEILVLAVLHGARDREK